MKKFIVCFVLAAMVLSAAACAKKTETPAETTAAAAAQLANPWVDCTLKDIQDKTGLDFGNPVGAKDISYRLMESEQLGEMNFTLENGANCCARVKPSAQVQDISGMNYTWGSTAVVESGNRTYTVSKTKDGKVQLCSWFDAVPGVQWTLSVSSDKDLGDFNIVPVADQTFVTMQGEA